jgi:hypothetical protein
MTAKRRKEIVDDAEMRATIKKRVAALRQSN